MADSPTVLIMAAGQGTRMRSSLPKVLHPVCGRPLLHWVVNAARDAGAGKVVAITRPGDGVAEHLPEGVEVAEQTEGEGTGSAILAARANVDPGSTVVILSGDVPLIAPELIAELVAKHDAESAAATLLTTEDLDPTGYGRIIRTDDGAVAEIVETKYSDGVAPEVLATREINVGVYAFDGDALFKALDAVGETRGERYLTDVFPLIKSDGGRLEPHVTTDVLSSKGVNTRKDLAEVAELAQRRIVATLAESGVTFEHPQSAAIDATVTVGPDTTIGPNVTLRGNTQIGSGVTILHAVLVDCIVQDGATVGPFAYLRPEANIGEGAKIGTYVEVKKSNVGAGAKVPHLSYIGDADIGEGANVGGGAITANYHRKVKNRTTIGKSAKTGVHNSFVAPVTVGDGAYTAAGSVITDDVPDGALAVARAEQKNVEGYAKKVEEGSEK